MHLDDDELIRVDELITRYELEPGLRDVYVEGIFDNELLSYCYQNSRNADCVIYEIDSVNVSNELLSAHGLTVGNKQKVIALARELSRVLGDCAYRCVVDRDLDHWMGTLEKTPRLVWTKWTSIETYFLESELVRDLMIITGKARIADWATFYQSLLVVLTEMYALRLVDAELGFCMAWVSFEKSLSINSGMIEFDVSGYLPKLLQKNSRSKDAAAVSEKLDFWRRRIKGDERVCVRGHDFIEVTAWAIGKLGGIKGYADDAALERLLILTSGRVPELLELPD